MSPDDPMRQSGARWCDEHGRWECSRRTKAGADCHESAIAGRDVGRMHAGEKTAVAKAKGEANLLAWSLQAAASAQRPDLHQLMLDLIAVTAARAELYAADLRAQYEGEGAGGLVGATWAVGRGGEAVQSGEQVRGLAKLEGDERDKLARYIKSAHDMGIATMVIELAAGQAAQTVTAVRAGMDALQLTPADRDVFLRAFLPALGNAAAGVSVVPGVVEGSPS